ncbi:hypothetical protein VM98_34395, partial [Streptomyces rubellomurinus subsp. indigoferus]
MLLTALALAVAEWRAGRGEEEEPAVLVELAGHGREAFVEGLDLSRTVAWFTSVHPVRLDVAGVDRTQVANGGVEPDGVHAGEPADRAGQV